MEIVNNIKELRELIGNWKAAGETIGFVPTMGYLHQGHLSLVEMSKQSAMKTIASIYVNPSQFNDPSDFLNYPIDLDRDKTLLVEKGTDALYFPTPDQMYPYGAENNNIWVVAEKLDKYLCGASRPGHFRGVLTVVIKLFNQVQPDMVFFGKKDWQQSRLIQEMVESFFMPIEIKLGEITREGDGLAMSSRNVRLSQGERKLAPGIFRAMTEVKDLYAKGNRNPRELTALLNAKLSSIPLGRLDYAQIVHKEKLFPYQENIIVDTGLIAVALFFGEVRLIDNLEL